MAAKQKKTKKPKNSRTVKERIGEGRIYAIILLTVALAAMLLLCMAIMSPERYDLKVGDVAKKTITASKDVLDEVSTQRRRDAAAASVAPVYYKDESVSQVVLSDLKAAFEELESVQALGEQWREEGTSAYTEEQYAQAGEMLTHVSLSNYQLATLLNADAQSLDELYESVQSATRTTLIGTIPEGQESSALSNIQQLVAYNTRSDLWWNVATPVLRACVQANMKIDQEATEENRKKAQEEIEPVYYKQGQNIVIKGDRVTESQLNVLTSLGLLEGDRLDLELYLGTGLLLLLLLAMFVCLCALCCPQAMSVRQNQTIMLLVGLLNVLVCVVMAQVNVSMMPIALGALILAVAIDARTAVIYNVFLALMLCILTIKGSGFVPTQALTMITLTLGSGTIGIFAIRRAMSRGAIVRTGVLLAVLNFVTVIGVGLLTSNDLTSNLNDALYAMGGGMLSAILCVGVMPVLESMFNLCTPTKLLELANPNHPILRRLMIEASGTYHHSVIVANIAEAAAEAVGANALLVRVGAYYHDIGKLKRPIYFKENQMGENPHDYTDPRVSNAIIIEHPRDGVALGQKHHLPQPVLDLIIQHHGDTPVMYFYHKATQMYGAENVDIADFRYAGPKPQTREAAILMLADTVEAAVRALPDPTPEKMMQTIRKLVRGKVDDGQMDESPLTFKDINRICEAFATVLNGAFHERIEYPDVNIPKKQPESAREISPYLPTAEDEKRSEMEQARKDAQAERKAVEAAQEQMEQARQEVAEEIAQQMEKKQHEKTDGRADDQA